MDLGTGAGTRRAKQWIALGIAGTLVLLVGGWALLVSPKKAEAALLREQIAMQAAANERTETHQKVLRSKAEQVPEREAYLREVATRIPGGPAVPELLRTLSSTAASAGVELVSVVPGTPTAVGTPAAAAAPAPAGAAPVPAAAAAPTAAAPAPADGLLAVPLTLEVVGGFYDIEQFVAELEDLPRALRLTGVSLTVAGDATRAAAPVRTRSLRTTLTGSVFVRGIAPGTGAATTPGAGPGTGTAGAPAAAPVGVQPAETTS